MTLKNQHLRSKQRGFSHIVFDCVSSDPVSIPQTSEILALLGSYIPYELDLGLLRHYGAFEYLAITTDLPILVSSGLLPAFMKFTPRCEYFFAHLVESCIVHKMILLLHYLVEIDMLSLFVTYLKGLRVPIIESMEQKLSFEAMSRTPWNIICKVQTIMRVDVKSRNLIYGMKLDQELMKVINYNLESIYDMSSWNTHVKEYMETVDMKEREKVSK